MPLANLVSPDLGAVLFAALAVVVAILFIAIRLGPRRGAAAAADERTRDVRERLADLEAEVRRLRERLADLEADVQRPPGSLGSTAITDLGGPGATPAQSERAPWKPS